MRIRPPEVHRPGTPPGLEQHPVLVAQLPVANAVTAVVITIAALLGAVAVLLVMPGELEALGTAMTITGSGFTLAAKIAVPRSG